MVGIEPPEMLDYAPVVPETEEISLARCIAKESPVLMVGAGLSCLVGYPSWPDLMGELKEVLNADVEDDHPLLIAKKYDMYVDELLEAAKNRSDYFPYLRNRFAPRNDRRNYDQLHVDLLELPFCGIITTNYDSVLEYAASVCLNNTFGKEDAGLCSARDLCKDPSFIFDFIRTLTNGQKHRREILHLHGYHENPREIILGYGDYIGAYGRFLEKKSANEVTLHHKVIWSLLVTHPFIFWGFGMGDPYFMRIPEIIKREFDLGSTAVNKPTHFAVLPNQDLSPELLDSLNSVGIKPVKYSLQVDKKGKPDYREGLSQFVDRLKGNIMALDSQRKDVVAVSNGENDAPTSREGEIDVKDVTKKMLDRI